MGKFKVGDIVRVRYRHKWGNPIADDWSPFVIKDINYDGMVDLVSLNKNHTLKKPIVWPNYGWSPPHILEIDIDASLSRIIGEVLDE